MYFPLNYEQRLSEISHITILAAVLIIALVLQGEKMKELNHTMLKESVDKKGCWIQDISVSDGRMVVACRDEGVMYFNLL